MIDPEFRRKTLTLLKAAYSSDEIEALVREHGTPLLLVNKKELLQRYRYLCDTMSSVKPHFAIKSCPMPEVLDILKSVSANLDVATTGEIEMLKKMSYPPELLIHTHPHKRPEDMKYAFDYGIRTFVLDDVSEIPILEPYKKDIKVIIRLSFPNKDAAIDLSYKFGLDPENAFEVTRTLLNQDFNVYGVSFHVGSQVGSLQPYENALTATRDFFARVERELDHNFSLLDIGGGFPAPYIGDVVDIAEFAGTIDAFVRQNFSKVEVISEPGRYLINPCITLVTKVIARTERAGKDWLFLDDGIYGSFSDMLSGHMHYCLFGVAELDGAKTTASYIVAGPTCDSIDVVSQGAVLPEMDRGDLIIAPNIGAYSYALASEFNSIPKAKTVVV